MRLFVVAFAVAVAVSTQAMALEPLHQRDARMTRKADVDGGCGADRHRGVGARASSTRQRGRTGPIRTGRRATTRLARKIPRAAPNSSGSQRPTGLSRCSFAEVLA